MRNRIFMLLIYINIYIFILNSKYLSTKYLLIRNVKCNFSITMEKSVSTNLIT